MEGLDCGCGMEARLTFSLDVIMEDVYSALTRGIHRPKKHKVALFLCGAAGTGKTSTMRNILKDVGIKGTFVYLNLDVIADMTGSRETAFQMFGRLVRRTMDDGYSFVFDGTCRDTKSMPIRISTAHQNGYRVVIGITYATLNTALHRILHRTHQPVPEDIAREIYRQFSNVGESFMKLKTVDDVYLYNNEHTSTLILHKDKKSVQCFHSDSDFYFDVSGYC